MGKGIEWRMEKVEWRIEEGPKRVRDCAQDFKAGSTSTVVPPGAGKILGGASQLIPDVKSGSAIFVSEIGLAGMSFGLLFGFLVDFRVDGGSVTRNCTGHEWRLLKLYFVQFNVRELHSWAKIGHRLLRSS